MNRKPTDPLINVNQIARIDCDGSVDEGMTVALNLRFAQMYALRDAALDWSDPEGLHKMRVASRRLRGALRDFAPYIEKRRLSVSLKKIREIAQALGRVRDQDVAIMTLERLSAKAAPEVAAGISRLVQSRDADRQIARLKLTPILNNESLSALSTKFTAALQVPPQRERTPRSLKGRVVSATEITYRDVARSIILTRLDELEKLSRHLYQPLKIKPLHNMRIAAKHLRYALELFEPCWGAPVGFLAKRLAELQSSLGKLHDCDVWIEDLGEIVNKDERGPNLDYRATLIWLLCIFIKLRSKHLSAALIQWQEWEAKDLSKQLRESIAAPSPVSQTELT